ncbi:MAG: GNAT family N-acetyltransferase [Xanthobacteraceae bacterium]|nr:GNAT family N-acetyltransferase [Xanthobacteraceae bacterium]
MSIRPAVESECAQLAALQLRASLGNPGDRGALLANPYALEFPREQIAAGQVFVAERNGAVVGFAVVRPRADGDIELEGLFVDPAAWRQGIGRALVDHCVAFAATANASALHLLGNAHAEGFYRGCGFETVGTHAARFGVGLLMRKKL